MTVVESSVVAAPPEAGPDRRRRAAWRRLVPLAVLVVAACIPYTTLQIPGVFDAPMNMPGTLQLLALCMVFGALATGYDLLFGRSGMLSFGHALYFAAGVYGTDILVTRAGWAFAPAAVCAVVFGALLSLVLGSVALRTSGIAFAMVTLAFAQVIAITIARDPGGLTGGEEGLPLDSSRVPGFFVGVVNTVNLYWFALAVLVVTVFVAHRVADAPVGRVLAAIRDDERRVGVLGLNTYAYRLFAFTLSGALAALAGVAYVLLLGGANPHQAASDLTLTLLVMVVLGGPGTRWGPLIGGVLFTYLDHRLTAVGGSLRGPLAQPLFVLGTIFILAVYFFPGGIAGLPARLRRSIPGDRGK